MNRIKELLKTPRGKIIALCCCLLAGSWTVILFQRTSQSGALMPDSDDISRLKQDIRKLKAEYQKRYEKVVTAEKLKKQYEAQLDSCWQESKNGPVETALRTMAQNVARELEMTFSSLGSVRVTRINSELYFAEIDNISLSASYEMIIKFMAAIQKCSPKLYWRRFDLRAEPQRGQTTNQKTNLAGGVAASAPGDLKMRFSGALRTIGFDGKPPQNKGGAQKASEKTSGSSVQQSQNVKKDENKKPGQNPARAKSGGKGADK